MGVAFEVLNSLPFDVAIVGLGIIGVHQLTREAEETLRRCRHTFVVDSGFGVLPYLQGICETVTDLVPLYQRGKHRLDTYRQMAAQVINAALTSPPVCFATYGHPLVYCYPAVLIQEAAKVFNLQIEIFPGISALDTLMVDLGLDVATDGLQMYEATDLLLRRRPVQDDVPCIIWQADVFGVPTYKTRRTSKQGLLPLQNYLLEFYPPGHPVTLVVSRIFPLQKSIVETYRMESLALEFGRGPQAGTLYIPPVRRREITDHKFLERISRRSQGAKSARNLSNLESLRRGSQNGSSK
jgi:precorrin-3B methylase